jgi:hypothetical protein
MWPRMQRVSFFKFDSNEVAEISQTVVHAA